jgi:hypothetical protein
MDTICVMFMYLKNLLTALSSIEDKLFDTLSIMAIKDNFGSSNGTFFKILYVYEKVN